MAERAPIFDADELDLTEFAPKPPDPPPRPSREAIRSVAEQRGFVSREPSHAHPEPELTLRRRYTTGRNRQLNLKVTEEAIRRFYSLADAHGWVLGEAFEHAIDALERRSNAGPAPAPERTSDIGQVKRS